jgi:hypothetical protein
MVRFVTALRRLLLLLIAAGLAGVWLRRRLEPPSPELPASGPGPLEIEPARAPVEESRLEMGPVTDEMNAIPLPLEEELAMVAAAEPEAAAEDEPDAEEEPADEEAPADEELARAETAESEVRRVERSYEDHEKDSDSVDIVAVVDDLLEPPS